jgi:cytochrome c-type biogenesis protein CcmH
LLAPDAHASARTEAARRLLGSADAALAGEVPGGRRSRIAVLAGAVAAALAALCLYVLWGSPGMPDQPYGQRLAAWRRSDPATLGPAQMAALLREIVKTRPHDPQAYDYLGRAELTSGDAFAAARAFSTAAGLAPRRADLRAMEGMALVSDADGKITPEARAAFRAAAALDPNNAPSRYYLGRAKIADGDVKGGLADWRALVARLPADDPRRAALQAEIDAGGAPARPAPATPSGMPQGQMAFIHAMVARQAAELRAHPDNADGWARLVRSYGVLGDRDSQARALADARKVFASRPDALKKVQAEAPGL